MGIYLFTLFIKSTLVLSCKAFQIEREASPKWKVLTDANFQKNETQGCKCECM